MDLTQPIFSNYHSQYHSNSIDPTINYMAYKNKILCLPHYLVFLLSNGDIDGDEELEEDSELYEDTESYEADSTQ